MNTIYQFGQAQFIEDLILGWCFRGNDESAWTLLKDQPTVALKELDGAAFPAYIPDSLTAFVKEELERRHQLFKPEEPKRIDLPVENNKATQSDAIRLKTAEELASRRQDEIMLMRTILEGMKVTINGSLKSDVIGQSGTRYVTVWRTPPGWSFVAVDGYNESHPTIDKIVERILARWW